MGEVRCERRKRLNVFGSYDGVAWLRKKKVQGGRQPLIQQGCPCG